MEQQYVTPEHLLFGIAYVDDFRNALRSMGGDANSLQAHLDEYLSSIDEKTDLRPELSVQLGHVIVDAVHESIKTEMSMVVDWQHYVVAILGLKESWAAYFLRLELGDREAEFCKKIMKPFYDGKGSIIDKVGKVLSDIRLLTNDNADADYDDSDSDDGSTNDNDDEEKNGQGKLNPNIFFSPFGASDGIDADADWHTMVTCVNDECSRHNPLIGRRAELERTVQVLCRKDKNNPLHVGEPGVGKTALVYGLADMINRGDVPERLKNCRIYSMDMGSMLAGTQYRGDFENRIKKIMDGAKKEPGSIIYIDEIHTIVSNGHGSDGPGAADLLKPYLENGDIRFIGSTTYEDFKRSLAGAKSVVRRFQLIDIKEPSEEETVEILNGLKKDYSRFHKVVFDKGVIEYAVHASAKYVTDRCLPDKAIDIVDEAGAWRELHPKEGVKTQHVGKDIIRQVLMRTCRIDASALKSEDNKELSTLLSRMQKQIFGQDEAVRQVVEAVQMAKAGLQDDGKPLASLLFVGPTGVGKTEVARVLAQELGVSLVRFDMSEYSEKHTVAKLIGSPAGYVGYEDGGLLTDAIRKTPNCVLLLDEIEKAHQDIYNILLQVMDYAVLTDNRGRKADFRNVIIIMTSNAGAQYASQASVGFTGSITRGQAMLDAVKKMFRPEFINRLSQTVVFRDITRAMASAILDKKLARLEAMLKKKKVSMTLDEAGRSYLLEKGFTPEYGAREMDRVIARDLKPLLMRGILFGRLAKGGTVRITRGNDGLAIE